MTALLAILPIFLIVFVVSSVICVVSMYKMRKSYRQAIESYKSTVADWKTVSEENDKTITSLNEVVNTQRGVIDDYKKLTGLQEVTIENQEATIGNFMSLH